MACTTIRDSGNCSDKVRFHQSYVEFATPPESDVIEAPEVLCGKVGLLENTGPLPGAYLIGRCATNEGMVRGVPLKTGFRTVTPSSPHGLALRHRLCSAWPSRNDRLAPWICLSAG